MKKILIILLIAVQLFSIVGCKTEQQEERVVLAETDDITSDINESVDALQKDQATIQDEHLSSSEKLNTPAAQTDPEQETDDNVTNELKNDTINNSDTEANEQKDNKVSYGNDEDATLSMHTGTFLEEKNSSSDTFLCTIVDSKSIDEPLNFPNFLGFKEDVMVYKVKIEKTYRSTFVTPNTYINVIAYVGQPKDEWEENYAWVNPFEIGEKYIITGLVQPYKGKPVMVNSSGLSAHIDDDGTLTPQSYVSSLVLSNIKTLDEFENDSMAKEFFASKYEHISTLADDYEATRNDSVIPENGDTLVAGDSTVSVKADNVVVNYIKNAIIID